MKMVVAVGVDSWPTGARCNSWIFGPSQGGSPYFQVGPPLCRLPFAQFKVKVIECTDGSFVGVPNVARRLPDGSPDWVAGLGDSIDEALEDALSFFAESIRGGSAMIDDYEWAAFEDC